MLFLCKQAGMLGIKGTDMVSKSNIKLLIEQPQILF